MGEDVDNEALLTLIVNKLQKGLQVCAVKAPYFGDNRLKVLEDIAVMTGGQVVAKDVGLKLEEADVSVLGTCQELIVSKDETIMMHGKGEPLKIKERTD